MSNTVMHQEEKVHLNRILCIDEEIRNGTYPNANRLAKQFEVSSRTILRDLEYLQDIYNAPLKYNSSKRGFYYTESTFFIKSIFLSEGELFSIALFDQLLVQYRNTPLEQTLRIVFDKISQSLPEKVSVQSSFLTSKLSFIPEAVAKINPSVFEALFVALKLQRTIEFEYRPLQKNTWMKRHFDPYHAICSHGNWYMIGFCHLKKEIKSIVRNRLKKRAPNLTGPGKIRAPAVQPETPSLIL
jgi:predicted DNA-binding transcriptional regulator YafY